MIRKNKFFLYILAVLLLSTTLQAAATDLKLEKVTVNTWAIVGPQVNRNPQNLGNNATFGFVVASAGVVLVDSGGSYKGANEIHHLIKSVTDKPVRYVINSGGQDHRWFGNSYFSKLGATIISSEAAHKDQQARLNNQWTIMQTLIGKDNLAGTVEKFADITFKDKYILKLGGTRLELYYKGQAHTPGDIFIWLPKEKVMFAGDIVFTGRMLGIGEQSNSKSWIQVFDAMAAFKPEYIVPGHGSVCSLQRAKKDTRDYIDFLRKAIAAFIKSGGGDYEISRINQSRFHYLKNYDTLHGRNALKVYTELEWE